MILHDHSSALEKSAVKIQIVVYAEMIRAIFWDHRDQ